MHDIVREYGSEFDWNSNNKYFNTDLQHSYFEGMDGFRSGRDALKAIAFKYKEKYKRVLLPALCCEAMVSPFRMYGYEINFFKLNSDISADFEDVIKKTASNTILVYMDYFGISLFGDQNLNHIQKKFKNTIFIEDRTHDIFMKSIREFIPDYTVCSIRKWISVPDGGILYSRLENGGFEKDTDTYFGEIRALALKDKNKYLMTGDIEIKTMYRKKIAEANRYLDNAKNIADISSESVDLLKYIDFEKIVNKRRENAHVLSHRLKEIEGVKTFLSERELGGLYFPILIENRDVVQRVLAENNIYCPVIWPLPKESLDLCKESEYISNHMLALPCDQRYEISDMRYICDNFKKVMETHS